MIIHLPFPPSLLSPNARPHWAAKARATRDYRFACKVAGLEARQAGAAGSKHVTMNIAFDCARGPLPDKDNCLASFKAGIDGLRDAKILVDDTPEWLDIGSLTVRRGSPSGVVVEIEESR